MLLRSSSTPILNSWWPNSKVCSISSPEPEFGALQRTSSISFHSPSSNDDHKLSKPLNLADNSIQNDVPKPRKSMGKAIIATPHSLHKQAKQETDGDKELESEPKSCRIRRQLFSSSGLGEPVGDGEDSGAVMQTLVMGGGEENGGGKICGGGGSGGGVGGVGSGFFESDSTDVYYQKMVEANPGNPLLLGNYAKFLKEIRGDYSRAEEFCGRAILANPDDGNLLALYADLIWHNQNDIQRAKSYFEQAVKTAPNDCFVMASYAKFLWEEEEEEERYIPPPTDFFLPPPQHASIIALS
ncbi:hypothetical protein ERO13_A06G114700v2 [Gossypium hirsutum]|uniref:Uncharacterized protein n=1 Tax=Gossypium hirsutum TaxID=3635 RepID=A0A1U8PQD9_GOSHI|nr:uncharacterized protein LOC107961778 [Gossypium hirsutum]KAG4195517.1 hypothetical protein ERO13_A06G114700v2 [Gossypium hirsutum]